MCDVTFVLRIRRLSTDGGPQQNGPHITKHSVRHGGRTTDNFECNQLTLPKSQERSSAATMHTFTLSRFQFLIRMSAFPSGISNLSTVTPKSFVLHKRQTMPRPKLESCSSQIICRSTSNQLPNFPLIFGSDSTTPFHHKLGQQQKLLRRHVPSFIETTNR